MYEDTFLHTQPIVSQLYPRSQELLLLLVFTDIVRLFIVLLLEMVLFQIWV